MTIKEFLLTEEGQALKVIIAKGLNSAGVDLSTFDDDVEDIKEYLLDANDLEPDNGDVFAGAVVLIRKGVEETKSELDDKLLAKADEILNIFNDDTNTGFERGLKTIGVVFQSKRKSLK